MAVDLAEAAKQKEIRYFLISFVDLFGVLRAKLVPAEAIGDMQEDGAGFAAFAAWLDSSPAEPDMLVKPDPDSLIQLPWKPEVGWLAGDCWMEGEPMPDTPRLMLKGRLEEARQKGYRVKTGVEAEYFRRDAGRRGDFRSTRYPGQALLRPVGPDAALRCRLGNLRRHAGAWAGAPIRTTMKTPTASSR